MGGERESVRTDTKIFLTALFDEIMMREGLLYFQEASMRRLRRRGLILFLCALLLNLPLLGNTPELVGVAKARGPAQINGMLLPEESSVFAGDHVTTGVTSTLTIFSGSEERIRLGPASGARLLKQGGVTVVALEEGAVSFRSRGQTQVVMEKYNVTVRGQGFFPAVAEVALTSLASGVEAQVWALKGSVEVAGPNQSFMLKPGQSALIFTVTSAVEASITGETVATANTEPQAEADTGSLMGTVVDSERVVVMEAEVVLTSDTGVTYTARSNQVGAFRFDNLPPGRYSLHISARGLRPYQQAGIEITAGSETSLGAISLQGSVGGVGGGRKTVLVILVGGAGAGAALAFGLRGRGDGGTPVSPSQP